MYNVPSKPKCFLLCFTASIFFIALLLQQKYVTSERIMAYFSQYQLFLPCSRWNKLVAATRQCYESAFANLTDLLEIDLIVVMCSANLTSNLKQQYLHNLDDVKGYVPYRNASYSEECISLTLGIGTSQHIAKYLYKFLKHFHDIRSISNFRKFYYF